MSDGGCTCGGRLTLQHYADCPVYRPTAPTSPQTPAPDWDARATPFWETKHAVTQEEAWAAANRLINSHFHRDEHARVSIPADTERDDDLLILSYIVQQGRSAHASGLSERDAPTSECDARAIAADAVKAFQTFGAGSAPAPGNPISVWMADRPAMFAMGVNVEDVVRFVLDRAGLSERDAGWQPIESAPRDGTMILIAHAGYEPTIGSYRTRIDGTGRWAWRPESRCAPFDDQERLAATHWRPLPAPPDPKDQQAPPKGNE